ncbi:hypothetical protein BJX68DRAFT_275147 [Aspergillus pseudodeflectus]|uniref:NAD(P)-binding protein n=1 Tax=Aspergillus pseudodeflectus TaxID=176178 RepID=A0ABR4KH93_9EURO
MDLSHLPTNHFAKVTQFTNDLYRDVYPSIDPSGAALSQEGKVSSLQAPARVSGDIKLTRRRIQGLAVSFAKANEKALILVGQNKEELGDAAMDIQAIRPGVQIDIRLLDISSEIQVKDAFIDLQRTYSKIDILVNNAGFGNSLLPITDIPGEKWWYDFQVVVKGTFLMTQQFLQLNDKATGLTIINITSAAAINVTPGLSSYSLSKLCQIQLQSFVRAENPRVRAVSLHPGMVKTEGIPPAFHHFAQDTFELVGGAAVWLASDQAPFMDGTYMSVNWCVDELIARRDEIIANGLLEVRLRGEFSHFE